MGISSVLKLISPDFVVTEEEDFDKTLETGLRAIADSLPAKHPFRRLMDLLDAGDSSEETEELNERIEKSLGTEVSEMGFVVIPPHRLESFTSYARGDLDAQWNGLFPGRKPGLLNWLDYHLRLKSIERQFKNKPQQPEIGWYRDTYAALLNLIARAISQKSYLVREMY